MADYYPLISRALDGLSDKSPDMRRAVYERARSALMAQLQSLNPPLPAAEITRERLALDEAIDRVEIAYALSEASLQPPPPAAYAAGPLGRTEPRPAQGTARPGGRVEPLPRPGARAEPPPLGAPKEPFPTGPRTEPLPRSVTPLRPGAAAEPPPPGPERGPEDFNEGEAFTAQPRERPRVDTVGRAMNDPGRTRAMVLAGVLAVVVGLIAIAAWLLRVQPSEIQDQPAAVEGQAPAENDAKLGDRVTGERAPGAAPGSGPAQPAPGAPPRPDVSVAQRAILYEENPSDAQNPRATPGRALWRLDAVNPGQGQALETVVRANIDTSGANFSLALSLRRNNDSTLPASHIIELTFSTGDDPNRMVRDVGLLQFKGEEAVRGTPVAGLPVPVKDNVFLIGLSNLPGDMERNRDLMLRRNWIDLPVRFASGQRAILSFEKGVSGDQVLNEAFRLWGQ